MVDISNKALALVLVAAIVVSLSGTMVSLNKLGEVGSLTGFATSDTGDANITITSDLSIEFSVSLVDFGSGYTNGTGGGIQTCTMDTNGTYNATGDCVDFNAQATLNNLTITNIGNVNTTDLTIQWDANETAIGGTGAMFNYSIFQNESNSCASGLASTAWTTAYSNETTSICTVFEFADARDQLGLGVQFVIPEDATVTAHSFTATVQASG